MSETLESVQEFVLDTVADRFNARPEQLSAEASLKSLGIDSLGGVEISLAIKKRFHVAFVAGEIAVDFTLGDIAELTLKKLAEAGGPEQ
jgi:acyl carrier protein